MKLNEEYLRQKSIENMRCVITEILDDNRPSIYLYGSIVLNDFRLGWSDIDIIVLTERRISQTQAQDLVLLRQKMLETEPDNMYYRSFEGGMLTLSSFVSKTADCVVYWGTGGQKITDKYAFDSFSTAELLKNGKLLYGKDVRSSIRMPKYSEFYEDVSNHYETIRKYAQTTDRSFYSFGWLLDIARGIYTLRNGEVISKTEAGEWALINNLCPVPEILQLALKVRKEPLLYRNDKEIFNCAETLGSEIQAFADVMEKELETAKTKVIIN